MSNIGFNSYHSSLVRMPQEIVHWAGNTALAHLIAICFQNLIATFEKIYQIEHALTVYLIDYLSSSAIKTDHLFRRLLTKPTFNPYLPKFNEKIGAKEKNAVILELEIAQISSFFQDASFIDDLTKVKKIKDETVSKLELMTDYLDDIEVHYPNFHDLQRIRTLKGKYQSFNQQVDKLIKEIAPRIRKKWDELCDSILQTTATATTHEHETHFILDIQKLIHGILPDHGAQFLIPPHKLSEAAALTIKEELVEELPFVLKNIGNSCYLASALQALFCLEETRTRLCKKLEIKRSEEELHLRENIQKQTVELVNKLRVSSQHFFSFFDATPLKQLREAIFSSKLHLELSDPTTMWTQQDAAAVVELFMTEILGYSFNTMKIFSTEEIPGRDFLGPIDPNSTLQLTLTEKQESSSLQDSVNAYFDDHLETDVKDFDIEGGTVSVSEYHYKTRLEELPEVMALHIKRFHANREDSGKIDADIVLPEDGRLDFSTACEAEQTSCDIVGYIVHHGDSIRSGHYTACIRKDGRFFNCNDGIFREISREEFYSEKKAYIVIAKRT